MKKKSIITHEDAVKNLNRLDAQLVRAQKIINKMKTQGGFTKQEMIASLFATAVDGFLGTAVDGRLEELISADTRDKRLAWAAKLPS